MKKLIYNERNFKTRDPFVTKHNGKYYHCFTMDTQTVYIACADTVDGLADAEAKLVYRPEEGKEYSKELWAPELHIIDNKCYIYVACDDGKNMNHRMYVLENNSDNPLVPYRMYGKITDSTDRWAIDATVMKYNDKMYFVWSGLEGEANVCQKLYIAEMKNPYELCSERVMISTPEQDWELHGRTGLENSPHVNEGPIACVIDGELYLFYSASGSGCDKYCIAYLKLTGSNPLDPKAWTKCKKPVFSSNDMVKGGGHCSIVCDYDKKYVFFHGWDKEETEIKWDTVSIWYGELKNNNEKIIIE